MAHNFAQEKLFTPAYSDINEGVYKCHLPELLHLFPLQSIQVVWTRGATTCEDCGGVGQRDQGLVSETVEYLLEFCGLFLYLQFVWSAQNEREPVLTFVCCNIHWKQYIGFQKARLHTPNYISVHLKEWVDFDNLLCRHRMCNQL